VGWDSDPYDRGDRSYGTDGVWAEKKVSNM
jgi:hypothetical protein